jgi:hypothetical protein
MSASAAAAIALSALGGTAELLGLVMVWREIASDRERGTRLLRALEAREPPERTYPGPTIETSSLSAQWARMGSPAYGSATQMHEVAKQIHRLETGVGNALVKLKQITDAELDRAVQALEHEVAQRDAELRDGLRYVLAGSTRERTIGVGLLLLGIVLATAGSVIGNLA